MNIGSGETIADTPFDEAIDVFRAFLSDQRLSPDLIWVFREDVIFRHERILIRTPVPTGNEGRAMACYELGQKRGFGVNLHAFCLLESRPCCYTILPEDDTDAQHLLMSGATLKCSVWTNLKEAAAISNSLKWLALGLFNRRSHSFSAEAHIPSKHSLLPECRVAHEG